MAVNVTTINTGNWSPSIFNIGDVVIGASEINQTIYLILATQKGSDPFRPNFGSDIWEHIDGPLNTAGPLMVRAIVESIERWEPRIKTISVEYDFIGQEINPGLPAGLCFTITWKLLGGLQEEITQLLIGVTSEGQQVVTVLGLEGGGAVNTENSEFITL